MNINRLNCRIRLNGPNWLKKTVRLALWFAVLLMLSVPVSAGNATAYTYTYAPNGWVRTQDAYLVSEILFQDFDLRAPEDLFLRGDTLYVADTGNKRVVTINISTKAVAVLIADGLDKPMGLYVSTEGDIYVADSEAQSVFRYAPDGHLIQAFTRPESVLYGKTASYKPQKVYVDKDGILYIVSEGAFDGIVQLTPDGDFMGYFGANDITASPLEALMNLIFTKEQQERMFRRLPSTFNNIAADNSGLIYTTTRGVSGTAVKKHNIAGDNLISQPMHDETDFVDLTVGRFGQIYAASANGLIYEYQNDGGLLFSFGGRAVASERNGLFAVVSALDVSDNNTLYILDKEKNLVHVFVPTFFAENINQAINLYEQGQYAHSKTLWTEIIRQSGATSMAYNGMALAEFQMQQFAEANLHFRIAENVQGYSNTYWALRNQWFTEHMAAILVVLFLVFACLKLLKWLDRKKRILNPLRRFGCLLNQHKLLRDIGFIRKFIRHPIDSFYYLRRDQNGVLAATVIYLIAFGVFVCSRLFMGFVINPKGVSAVSPIYVTLVFCLPVSLWVFCNYLVSSITDGRSRLRDVYNMTAYSLMPLIFIYPVLIIVSRFLTLNEIFIVSFGTNVLWAWCGVLLFVGLREINDFEFGEVVKNILVSVFLMAVVVIVFSMVYMFWDRLVEFIYSLVKEAGYRGR